MRPKKPFRERVIITLKRIFLPYWYWKEVYEDTVVQTYHPEIGSYWQPKEHGGLYLQQSWDEGYKAGYAAAFEVIVSNRTKKGL